MCAALPSSPITEVKLKSCICDAKSHACVHSRNPVLKQLSTPLHVLPCAPSSFCLNSSVRGAHSTGMASRLLLMLRHPWKTLAFSWMSIRYLSLALADRLLFPFACRPISFYTEITRCLLGSSLACFLELTFSAPPGLRTDEYQPVELNNVSTIVVPRETKLETLGSAATPRTVVLLYAHGGGYLFGEPLMYLDSYKRWTKEAESVGIRLVVVSVDYRGLPKLPTMKSLES